MDMHEGLIKMTNPDNTPLDWDVLLPFMAMMFASMNDATGVLDNAGQKEEAITEEISAEGHVKED